MSPDPVELFGLEESICITLLLGIDADGTYLVCGDGIAAFLATRVARSANPEIVHDGQGMVQPINFGLYRLGTPPGGRGQWLDMGFADLLVDQGLAEYVDGCDIAIGELRAAAKSMILSRIADPDEVGP